ncbi:MAG: protein-L-isoaspartate(D-aspartate) O-methyltransferase [Phycisphaerae bacterium]|nr:protein-L-isoaspartate(D-aspartate) O-methyltransferase [Phycisphaerae bacterium]
MSDQRDRPPASSPLDPYAEDRRRMIESQLRRRGVGDERVLEAMARIHREKFMQPGDEAVAYDDRAVSIQCGQTISQPYMVGLMTQLLQIRPDDRVLEIGTGSGYQTAILAALCASVYTVERMPDLSDLAARRLRELGLSNVEFLVSDGTLGWPEQAPFDGIMVTAGAPSIPQSLTDQLADGGRLVVPVGGEAYQTLTVVQRRGRTIVERPSIACRFVPLIGQGGWAPATVGDRSPDSSEAGDRPSEGHTP